MESAGTAGREPLKESFYLWEPQGKPVALHLAREAMDRVLLEALSGMGRLSRGRGVEVGGILLGTAERDGSRYVVRVEDIRPLPCEHAFGPSFVLSEQDREALRQALEKWKRAPDKRLYAVGYWRSHTREELALRAEDLQLLAAYFAHPWDIALLVEPHGAGPAHAALFCWEGGRIPGGCPEKTFLVEGPIAPARSQERSSQNPSRGAAAVLRRDATAEPAPSIAEAPPTPEASRSAGAEAAQEFRFTMFQPAEQPRQRRRRWLPARALLVLVVASFFAVDQGLIRLPQTRPERDPYAISLAGKRQGGNLHVTWDRSAPVVRVARRALLIITDGDETRTLELDLEQLRNGSVVYRPITDRVNFRLELSWDQRSLSETWSYSGASSTP